MKKKPAAERLRDMLETVEFSETPKHKQFNLEEFKRSAREVRKTFKDENISVCTC